jgi:hypothetical protein
MPRIGIKGSKSAVETPRQLSSSLTKDSFKDFADSRKWRDRQESKR